MEVGKTQVLIVEDSGFARAMLRKIVESDHSLEVMAAVADAPAAVRRMRQKLPDVILLDLELPEISGVAFLKKIMQQHPIPVVVCSSHVVGNEALKTELLEVGAQEVIEKPAGENARDFDLSRRRICDALRAAALSRLTPNAGASARHVMPKLSPDELIPPPNFSRAVPKTHPIVAIGASTGGTEALHRVLSALPADAPPIVIVQHMPQGFTGAFARRMNSLCAIEVVEGATNMQMRQGLAIIAPGDRHLIVRRANSNYRVEVIEGPHISRHRPSVDMLFRSTAISAGPNALGIIMTGMGDDGAMCLGEMRRAGATTIAQDEATSVVYGMPREAMQMGSAMRAVPLDKIPHHIMTFAHRHLKEAG